MRASPCTRLYVLRHAQPAAGHLPNADRPLSAVGEAQAQRLVPVLAGFGVQAAYSSPYRRAVLTVAPFCRASDVPLQLRDDLRESAADEELCAVRARMASTTDAIAAAHPGQSVVVCTHGGCVWGLITRFEPEFGYEEYRRIRCPDLVCVEYGIQGPSLRPSLPAEADAALSQVWALAASQGG